MFGFIFTSLEGGIVYDGDPMNLLNVVAKDDAITFFEWVEESEDVSMEPTSYDCLGEAFMFDLPMFTIEEDEVEDKGYVNRTWDMISFISSQSNLWFFNGEKTYLFWMSLLKRYKVYVKWGVDDFVVGFVYAPSKSVSEDGKKLYKLNKNNMLLKQFLDGMYMHKPMTVLNKGKPVEIKIYRDDLHVKLGKKKVNAFGSYFFQYSSATYKNLKFYKKTQKARALRKWVSIKDVEGKYRFDCWSNAYYNLAGTTIISWCRRLGKTMFASDLSINVCLSQDYFDPKREKVVVFFSYSQDQCYKFREHIMKLMGDFAKQWLLAETWDNIEFYEHFERQEWWKTIIDKRVIGKIICKTANGKNPGVGDGADLYILDEPERYDKRDDGNGKKIDWLKYIYDNIIQTFDEFPNTRILVISTQDENGRTDTEFYRMLREGEAAESEREENGDTIEHLMENYVKKYELDKYKDIEDLMTNSDFDVEEMINNWKYSREITGMRFSGWENEMRTPEQLERQAQMLKKRNYIKYCTEFECFSPFSTKLIYTNRVAVDEDPLRGNKFDFIVPVFDMGASWSDNRGYVCLWFDYNPGNTHNRICLLSEKEISGNSARQIKEVHTCIMNDCKKFLKVPESKRYFLVYDSRWVGDDREAYFEWQGLNIAMKFSSVWARKSHQNIEVIESSLRGESDVDYMNVYFKQAPKDPMKFFVDKTTNVNNTIFYMNNHYVAIDPRTCPIAMNEIRVLKRYFTKTSYTYRAEGRKNDGVFMAISMGMFYITKIMKFDVMMAKNRHDQIHQVIAEHITENNKMLEWKKKHVIDSLNDDVIDPDSDDSDDLDYEVERLRYSNYL